MPMRATKIVATLGPASSDLLTLERMVHAGLDVVRMNFSHGKPEDHVARAETLAQAAALPLTAITAWELLFDRLQVRDAEGRLLVVGDVRLRTRGYAPKLLAARVAQSSVHLLSVSVVYWANHSRQRSGLVGQAQMV